MTTLDPSGNNKQYITLLDKDIQQCKVTSSVSMTQDMGLTLTELGLNRFMIYVDGMLYTGIAKLTYSEVLNQYMLTLPGVSLVHSTVISLVGYIEVSVVRFIWNSFSWKEVGFFS